MLENGLEAMIVSDPKTDKAAAAMDVKVGHLSDPEDLPGLAHFCEHLMFMGTEKVKLGATLGSDGDKLTDGERDGNSTRPKTTIPSS